MKKISFLTLLTLSIVCTSLNAQTSILTYPTNTPALTDRFYLVIPPGGAANQRSPSLQNIFNGAGLNLSAETVPVAGDYVILYDVSTSTTKRVLCSDLTKALTAASATLQGVVTTGTQDFAGTKSIIGQVISLQGTPVYNLIPARCGLMAVNSGANAGSVMAVSNNTYIEMMVSGTIGTLTVKDASAGFAARTLALSGSSLDLQPQTTGGQCRVNDFGFDTDFRVAGDNDANMIFGDASTDRVGIGTATPATKLQVNGTTTTTSLIVGTGSTITNVISNTATLDFPSTLVSTISDLTITVTGAVLGDTVSIGVPNGSITATGSYFGWVSATNTVTIRFTHIAAGSEDPVSGTFRVTVTKF